MNEIEELKSRIQKIKAKKMESGDELLMALHAAQELFNNSIPIEAAETISELLKVKMNRVYELATFYSMYSTRPRGKHLIRFCESLPCHVVGGKEVIKTLKTILGVEVGETTDDGLFTLETSSCLGLCGVGPVMMIDGEAYGNLTSERVKEIIDSYRGEKR